MKFILIPILLLGFSLVSSAQRADIRKPRFEDVPENQRPAPGTMKVMARTLEMSEEEPTCAGKGDSWKVQITEVLEQGSSLINPRQAGDTLTIWLIPDLEVRQDVNTIRMMELKEQLCDAQETYWQLIKVR